MRYILFVDDEPFFAEPYISNLLAIGEVILEENAVDAVAATLSSERKWDAIILDIMMPSPPDRTGITSDGLDTGIWILHEIITHVMDNSIPIIILTSRNLARVTAAVEELERMSGYPPGLITIRSKIETPRFLLPVLVRAAIDKFRSREGL